MKTKFTKLIVLLIMIPFLSSCFGTFFLTRSIHKINKIPPTNFLENIFYWVLIIVPVYEAAILVDMIVFNLLEFWSGAEFQMSEVVKPDGTRIVLQPTPDGQQATLTHSREDQIISQIKFVRIDDSNMKVLDANNNLLGSVAVTESDLILMRDQYGQLVSKVSREQFLDSSNLAKLKEVRQN